MRALGGLLMAAGPVLLGLATACVGRTESANTSEGRRTFAPPTMSSERYSASVEVTVALLVSPECGACTDSSFITGWQAIHDDISRQAQAAGAVPAFIGVGVTWSIEDGLALLRHFAGLDEVIVGSNWLNTGFEEFADYDFPSRHSVPQVVVVRKTRQRDATGTSLVGKELLFRAIGLTEIRTWAERGALL